MLPLSPRSSHHSGDPNGGYQQINQQILHNVIDGYGRNKVAQAHEKGRLSEFSEEGNN